MTQEEFDVQMEQNRTNLALLALEFGYKSHEMGRNFEQTKIDFLKIWKKEISTNATKSTEHPGE